MAKEMDRSQSANKLRSNSLLLACLLAAFALRMHRLGQQPLAWDEGWSIALSSLGWAVINRITALDVHPPLYYDLFKLWLVLGRNELLSRFLSVIAGMVTVPLAYVTARAWCRTAVVPSSLERGERTGILAACVTALAPFLLYYSQVARMYALCAGLALLVVLCLLRAMDTGRPVLYLAFVFAATAALYTFYYSAFVIIAACVYALFTRPRHRLALLLSATAIAVLYAPWLLYAAPLMLARVGARTSLTIGTSDVLRFLSDGVFGLVFAYGTGWIAVYVIVALLMMALVLAWRGREPIRPLALPLLAVALTLIAVSVGARAHMFAARYLIPASPLLALLIAWALDAVWQRSKWLGVLGLVALVASTVPTLTHYVYEKSYEVSGAFDPQADYRYLRGKTSPDDIVFFNVLSLAGLYERFRTPVDPKWSYVLCWDPVVEPLEPALAERVMPASSQHRRMWFVLYKGTVGANLPLKAWLDSNLFPVFGQWRNDTLYLQYVPPTDRMARVEPQLVFGKNILLRAVDYTPDTQGDGPVTARLTWAATENITQNYKVFVHLYTADGILVTQHDSVPVNELRPTLSWHPGEEIMDNHGLWVPADVSGSLHLVVGLYDPERNARLPLPDGSDHAEIGTVQVAAKAQPLSTGAR